MSAQLQKHHRESVENTELSSKDTSPHTSPLTSPWSVADMLEPGEDSFAVVTPLTGTIHKVHLQSLKLTHAHEQGEDTQQLLAMIEGVAALASGAGLVWAGIVTYYGRSCNFGAHSNVSAVT